MFSLVGDGFCTHLFVVLVSGGFMNQTALLITQFALLRLTSCRQLHTPLHHVQVPNVVECCT
jgi:hypothetical protein